MPEDGCCSPERTAYKQTQFVRLLNLSIGNYKKTNSKYPYTYIDLTAGDGKNKFEGEEEAREGSALLAYKRIINDKDIPLWNISLVETKRTRFERLVKNINEVQDDIPKGCSRYVVRFPYQTMLSNQLIRYTDIESEGLVYTDPPGMADFSAFTPFMPYRKNLDFLFHIGCTGITRIRGASAKNMDHATRKYNPENLENHFSKRLETIKRFKTNWFITEPDEKWKWILLFGTNKEISTTNLGTMFYSLESPEGKEHVKKATYTIKELCTLNS